MTTIVITALIIVGIIFLSVLTLFLYWLSTEEIPYTESVSEAKIKRQYIENLSRN
ncbi:hypothetical protein SAMN02745116_01393 [Pilibacter termitis]|uniref:Uncharacterized protein n=1 Tax=Pilibacter termitis TaxID=263852 RepID=A0A1T4NDW9_9ENTE|nr:hypothetical protein [Pilibacter termitis]SJZ77333.1 hypothetical protein SAMN02745116_01393 [Pilibacter termitis]